MYIEVKLLTDHLPAIHPTHGKLLVIVDTGAVPRKIRYPGRAEHTFFSHPIAFKAKA
jgi:hypothetical protein